MVLAWAMHRAGAPLALPAAHLRYDGRQDEYQLGQAGRLTVVRGPLEVQGPLRITGTVTVVGDLRSESGIVNDDWQATSLAVIGDLSSRAVYNANDLVVTGSIRAELLVRSHINTFTPADALKFAAMEFGAASPIMSVGIAAPPPLCLAIEADGRPPKNLEEWLTEISAGTPAPLWSEFYVRTPAMNAPDRPIAERPARCGVRRVSTAGYPEARSSARLLGRR